MNRATARLAARSGIRGVEALIRADRAADSADRAVRVLWAELLRVLTTAHPWEAHRKALVLLRRMLPDARAATAKSLAGLTRWGHRAAVADLGKELPRDYLRAAVTLGGRRETRTAPAVRHAGLRDGRGRSVLGESLQGRRHGGCGHDQLQRHADVDCVLPLTEDDASNRLTLTDLLSPLRMLNIGDEPAINDTLPSLLDFLFPAPDESTVNRIVYASGWQERLALNTRLGSPETLAGLIASGVSQGKAPKDIARDLLPHVEGVRTTARRVARTEGVRVVNEVAFDAHEQLGDLAVGHQVHATIDERTRSWHASRAGEVYYKEPGPGQKSYRQMPRPPLEAEDPAERPPQTPKLAPNCRCWLSPVLRSVDALKDDPVFTTDSGKLIPDPATYSDWWDKADEKRRRLAVGAKRYGVLRDRGSPSWEDFLDPATGHLLTADELQSESAIARAERVRKVRAKLSRLRQNVRDVARYGFVPG